MKVATVKEIRTQLDNSSHKELIELCIRLSRFKKENKELLSYLLFESENEEEYISGIENEVDELYRTINTSSVYYTKKSVRKILRLVKKHIRYSKKPETEIELLLYFCKKFKELPRQQQSNKTMQNILSRELTSISTKLKSLHPDLQYDYKNELDALQN